MHDGIDYRALRQRVEQRVGREKRNMRIILFIVSLVMFLGFSIIGWGLVIGNGAASPDVAVDILNAQGGVVGSLEPLVTAVGMMTIGWALTLLYQFISLMIDSKAGERQMRERAMAGELMQEMARMGMEDEPEAKRKRIMRLSDDGELEALIDEPEETQKRA